MLIALLLLSVMSQDSAMQDSVDQERPLPGISYVYVYI